MRVSEMKRMLRSAKCIISREGANHEMWYSPITGKHFPVPRHNSQELMRGTAEKIMKDAGLK
ncbi:MAG: type II toxin-antitoxin system HicA family toxin [Clostridiales bacterium]|nr:type II toxin-antitoxin system HicA family toxin [Clostridiales bacterium]